MFSLPFDHRIPALPSASDARSTLTAPLPRASASSSPRVNFSYGVHHVDLMQAAASADASAPRRTIELEHRPSFDSPSYDEAPSRWQKPAQASTAAHPILRFKNSMVHYSSTDSSSSSSSTSTSSSSSARGHSKAAQHPVHKGARQVSHAKQHGFDNRLLVTSLDLSNFSESAMKL